MELLMFSLAVIAQNKCLISAVNASESFLMKGIVSEDFRAANWAKRHLVQIQQKWLMYLVELLAFVVLVTVVHERTAFWNKAFSSYFFMVNHTNWWIFDKIQKILSENKVPGSKSKCNEVVIRRRYQEYTWPKIDRIPFYRAMLVRFGSTAVLNVANLLFHLARRTYSLMSTMYNRKSKYTP